MSPQMTTEQVREARTLRAGGATYAVIAAQIGVSTSGIHYRLGRGADRPRRSQLSEEAIERMREQRAAGAPIKQLAEEFHVSQQVVSYHTATRERKQEPPPSPPTRDELLLSAYPWAHRLTPAEREQFGEELRNHPHHRQEDEITQLVTRWRMQAVLRAS